MPDKFQSKSWAIWASLLCTVIHNFLSIFLLLFRLVFGLRGTDTARLLPGAAGKFSEYIMAYLHKVKTIEPEKQPLLTNGNETFVSRLGRHVPAATDTNTTIEVL